MWRKQSTQDGRVDPADAKLLLELTARLGFEWATSCLETILLGPIRLGDADEQIRSESIGRVLRLLQLAGADPVALGRVAQLLAGERYDGPRGEALLNKTRAARFLNISTKTLLDWERKGQMPATRRKGKLECYLQSDLEAMVRAMNGNSRR